MPRGKPNPSTTNQSVGYCTFISYFPFIHSSSNTKKKMEATAFCGSSAIPSVYSPNKWKLKPAFSSNSSTLSPLLIKSMATQKPLPSAAKTVSSKKNSPSIKLLTRVEELRLLSKAEKAGLLSAAEKSGLSLSTIEKLGLLSKAEELGILSAATDPGTPGALLTLSLGLLLLGPSCVYFVPEDYPWQVAVQALVALVSVVGGSAAFAASNFVSNLQKSN